MGSTRWFKFINLFMTIFKSYFFHDDPIKLSLQAITVNDKPQTVSLSVIPCKLINIVQLTFECFFNSEKYSTTIFESHIHERYI